MKSISFLLLLFVCFSCKNNEEDASKITPTTEEQPLDPNAEISMDDILYSGVWTIKSSNVATKVILNQSNTDVSGTLEYNVFDNNGELNSSTGVLSLVGTVTNGILKTDIYDPKGVKASTATITVKDKELHFKLTGAQINYPNSFTAFKR
uniref:hypothetical protein n=1 Tax=Gelidibacter sp. TaxID=2018083 RepID=UPI00404961C1